MSAGDLHSAAPAGDGWLDDDRIAELLKEAKAKGDEFDPLLRAALLEIKQRRNWGRTAPVPVRRAEFSAQTTRWARASLETDLQNLCDDPFGATAGDDRDRPRELAILEEWEFLGEVAAELRVDFEEAFRRVATAYEQERMEKILACGRWHRQKAVGREPEDAEAL